MSGLSSSLSIDPSVHSRGFGAVSYGSDDALWVEFKKEPVLNAEKTKEANRPIHDLHDFIKIIIPGGKSTIYRPVKDEDKERFFRKWEAYQREENQQVGGTRLEDWGTLSAAQVADLKALSVFAVEQLANLSDAQIVNMGMGMQELRAKAKAFIDDSLGKAPLMALAVENEKLKAQLEKQQEQMNEILEKLNKKAKKQDGIG